MLIQTVHCNPEYEQGNHLFSIHKRVKRRLLPTVLNIQSFNVVGAILASTTEAARSQSAHPTIDTEPCKHDRSTPHCSYSEPHTTPSIYLIGTMLIQETHKDVVTQAGGDMSN